MKSGDGGAKSKGAIGRRRGEERRGQGVSVEILAQASWLKCCRYSSASWSLAPFLWRHLPSCAMAAS
eukprot:8281367-Prorocentrum_lima.AAC.1